MKKTLSLLIVFIPMFLFSQTKDEDLIFFKIDSLKKVAIGQKNDTNKVKTFFRIGVSYSELLEKYPELNDSIDCYFSKSEILSKTIKFQNVYAKRVLRYCRYIDLYVSKPSQEAVRKIRLCYQAIKIYSEIKDTTNLIGVYNNLIFLYNTIGDYEKSLELSRTVLQILIHVKDEKQIIYALETLGDSFYQLNQTDSSLYYYKLIFKKLETLSSDNKRELFDIKVGIINDICDLYSEYGNYIRALLFFKENEDVVLSCSDTLEEQLYEIVRAGSIIGNAYMQLKNYSSAVSCFENTIIRYNNGIDIYHRSWEELSNLYYLYGSTLKEMNSYPKAIEKLNMGLKYAGSNYSRKAEVLSELADTYQKSGNLAKALAVYKDFLNANDSSIIMNNRESNIKQAALISSEFDFKNQIENEQLENQKQKLISEEKNQKQKLIIWTTIFAIVVLIVVAFFILRTLLTTRKQKKLIEIQKTEVEEQKHVIDEKHKEITDSINYAERIQRSFLATKEQLDNNLSDYFILFKPKDVVSGDFYWSHTLQNGNFALVTADSTGHGVPGAIMSLLNTSSIERAVELGISEPAEILNHTRQTIIERLKKDGSAEGGKDGMDCSLISFNKEKSKFAYAAANNPIWIIRNKELIELAPDKIPVGKHDRDSVSFTQHEVEIQKGDMIYTLTDGFPDQFGGPKGKKFMYKKLKEMLITIAHKPTAEQQTVLKGTLKDWMGNTEQVDDVTIIGVRV